MSATTIFYQECPICGRSLRIAVKYYGRPMSCAHCEGEFISGKDAQRMTSSETGGCVPAISAVLAPHAFSAPQLDEV